MIKFKIERNYNLNNLKIPYVCPFCHEDNPNEHLYRSLEFLRDPGFNESPKHSIYSYVCRVHFQKYTEDWSTQSFKNVIKWFLITFSVMILIYIIIRSIIISLAVTVIVSVYYYDSILKPFITRTKIFNIRITGFLKSYVEITCRNRKWEKRFKELNSDFNYQ